MKPQFSNSNYLHPDYHHSQSSHVKPYQDPNLSATQYVPVMKQTGYIIGQPVYSQTQSPTKINTVTPKNIPNIHFDFHSPNRNRSPQKIKQSFVQSKHASHMNIVPHSMAHSMEEMVPRSQYDKCVTECRIWESKFNQLYQQYVGLGDGSDLNLKQQNMELKNRIRELQSKQRRLYQNVEDSFNMLVRKYEDSTLKECRLLTDRYKLQNKIIDHH